MCGKDEKIRDISGGYVGPNLSTEASAPDLKKTPDSYREFPMEVDWIQNRKG